MKKKKRWAIKSENGHKNPRDPDPSKNVRETIQTTVGRIYGKGKFWVWSGTEMEWCIVKVAMIMMMVNWWEKDKMTVTSLTMCLCSHHACLAVARRNTWRVQIRARMSPTTTLMLDRLVQTTGTGRVICPSAAPLTAWTHRGMSKRTRVTCVLV